MLQCEICEAHFKSEMALTGHQIAVHGSRDSHPCNLCPATFSEYSSLTAHITSVHLKPKPFACLKCSESFMTIQGMMEHITVHEEQNLSEEIVHEEQNQSEEMVHEEEKHESNFDSKRNGKVFEVEEIVKKRSSINGIEYFVKWKGYPSESNTLGGKRTLPRGVVPEARRHTQCVNGTRLWLLWFRRFLQRLYSRSDLLLGNF